MQETRILMGMPVTVAIVDSAATQSSLNTVFDYFTYVDNTFSTFKHESEISRINRKELTENDWSANMREVFLLCDKTKKDTHGYFNIVNQQGILDPSGLVKGWAINNAAILLRQQGFKNFYVEAGGDIQVQGVNGEGKPWIVGIKNPFNSKETVKAVQLSHNEGIATSGNYERGAHIYNPLNKSQQLAEIVSLTVIGPNVYEADRFATAAFAMSGSRGIEGQREGIHFIENLPDLEGYMIDNEGIATMTSGFEKFLISN